MKNKIKVKENLISLISKIGEKITIKNYFIDKNNGKFFLFHSALEKILER